MCVDNLRKMRRSKKKKKTIKKISSLFYYTICLIFNIIVTVSFFLFQKKNENLLNEFLSHFFKYKHRHSYANL